MNVLIDTPIWSAAFRKSKSRPSDLSLVRILEQLIEESRAKIMGPIRQGLLSGISDEKQYQVLRDQMRSFEDIRILPSDYENAAALFNRCRKKGIQGSHIDFLICAVAKRTRMAIFTTDQDFKRYAEQTEIELYSTET